MLTWKDVEEMGEDFMCECCGYGFDYGEWIFEVGGCYYHRDCMEEEMSVQVPEPPEPPDPDSDAAYDRWKEECALEEWEAAHGKL